MSRASKHAKQSDKRIEWLLKMHDDKTGGSSVSSSEIYHALQSDVVRRAMDWIVEIGGNNAFLWIMYGCCKCQLYPQQLVVSGRAECQG
jgi:hypothetical protein